MSPVFLCINGLMACIALVGPNYGDSIDPDETGDQYAWSENVGWINAEPLGDGGPGVDVADFALSGWMWGENIGWVNMSCENLSGCHVDGFGVRNDGQGNLSGFAWAENVGWINFAPSTGGVVIDPTTGDLSGHAWGENIGWIKFASEGLVPFKVTTDWTCEPPPGEPGEVPLLAVLLDGDVVWTPVSGATGYDVVEGDLDALRTTAGDFSIATTTCLVENRTHASTGLPDLPGTGEGVWVLVRAANCGGVGLYGGGRDSGILASGNDCAIP